MRVGRLDGHGRAILNAQLTFWRELSSHPFTKVLFKPNDTRLGGTIADVCQMIADYTRTDRCEKRFNFNILVNLRRVLIYKRGKLEARRRRRKSETRLLQNG